MDLSTDVVKLIKEEYKAFEDFMYDGKTKEERDTLAQFFTPAEVSIKLLEAYKVDSLEGKIIRDPTSGSGNLLAACLIAGADSDKIFGNDYDARMVILSRDRLNKLIKDLNARNWKGINNRPLLDDSQIHQGNALQKRCLIEFGEDYDNNYNTDFIDDLEYAQSYEHDEVTTFLGQTTINHINKISWLEENTKAQERFEKKQQLEKTKNNKVANTAEQVDYFNLFGGNNNE